MSTTSIAAENADPIVGDGGVALAQLSQAIEAAAHLLPSQGPIEVFVHHNTLHVFEEEPFHDAVVSGLHCYGANPYLPEQHYRQLLASGRIQEADLQSVLREHLADANAEHINGLGTREEIRLAMLRHPLLIGPDAELRWIVAETDALDRFRPEVSEKARQRILKGSRQLLRSQTHSFPELKELLDLIGADCNTWSGSSWESFSLHALWRICRSGIESLQGPARPEQRVRPRDILLHALGEDIESQVQDLLIRFCGAFLDQGYSDWELPDREQGFYESFIALFSQPKHVPYRWLRGLTNLLLDLKDRQVSALESVAESLSALAISADSQQELIRQNLLSLRGWAGMIWQVEAGVDWLVHKIPRGSLVGFLAVQLLLERLAIEQVGEDVFGKRQSAYEVIAEARKKLRPSEPMSHDRQAFLLFQIAQMLGWQPQQLLDLSRAEWHELAHEVSGFNSLKRRRIYHEAYERHYRHSALDAFAAHAKRRRSLSNVSSPRRPAFQIVTCIDDREESFRRHLEEVRPDCETFGAAGFFVVAMHYRGAADGFFKPLCPGVIIPDHYVQEDVGYTFQGVHRSRTKLRKRLGLAGHLFQRRSRTFLGGIVAGIVGSLATFPLVARVLFPRLTTKIRQRFGQFFEPPPVTRLQLERYQDPAGPENGHLGFRVDEMAAIVLRLLQDIGLADSAKFSRLVLICGHGSSSLNNPHESAYCCGACAGKRGGPNARAFAQLANDWRVRAKVGKLGIAIPSDTVFVGAYHNTCDDSVVFYDLDQMPASHRDDFELAREAIDEARRRNAHERCRRFSSVPLDVSQEEALRRVEARAQDISQPRPEYNHATNALCVVGRRAWTRGLFLDRRAFLTSYDPAQDDLDQSILLRILSAAIPVCAGISLEYYFSCVDHTVYGSGSKLPHNIASMLGVMEGTSSDLRTGLYQQMVEIHEPLRITFVIESTPAAMLSIMERNEAIGLLCRNSWVHLAVIDPATSAIEVFHDGSFHPYRIAESRLSQAANSLECYEGSRDHLPFSSIAEQKVAK